MSDTFVVVEIPEQLSMQSHLFQLGVFISIAVKQIILYSPKQIKTFKPNKSKDPGGHPRWVRQPKRMQVYHPLFCHIAVEKVVDSNFFLCSKAVTKSLCGVYRGVTCDGAEEIIRQNIK